jgi:putative oxidoreductase
MNKLFTMFDKIFASSRSYNLSLLILRLLFGGSLLLAHGLPKLLDFSVMATTFPDPLGIGSNASLSLVIFAEIICSIMIILGLGTRFFALPIIFDFLVIVFIVLGQAEYKKKELELFYLTGFLVMFLNGPGRFSLDYLLSKQKSIYR